MTGLKMSEEVKQISEEELTYSKAPLYKRWFATIIDIFIMVAISFLLYGATAAVTNNISIYQDVVTSRERVQEDSGLYDSESLITTSTEEADTPIQEKKDKLSDCTESFYYDFLQDESATASYEKRKAEASDTLGTPYFKEENGRYVEGTFPPEVYYDFYKAEIENYCLSALSLVPEYNRATRIITVTSVVELFISFAIGYSFSFILMPLFIKRGRRTVGMFIFKISLIGDDALNVRGKKLVARNILSFFIIFALSCFTFCIPVLVSLTMMHISKNAQSFLDYMCGTYVVNSAKQDVFLDYSEYEARHASKASTTLENKDLSLTNRKPGTY